MEIVEALEQLSNSNKGFRKKAFENCLKIISSENISSVEDLASVLGGGDKWVKSKTVRWTPPGLFSYLRKYVNRHEP